MKYFIKSYTEPKIIAFLIMAFGLLISCDDEKLFDPTAETGKHKTYTLEKMENASVQGTIEFTELADHSTRIEININGATSGIHPAHIYTNSMVETGSIAIPLNPIDGVTGKSETVVKKNADGITVRYDELLAVDANVKILRSETDPAVIAAADVGGNEISNISKTYTLHPVSEFNVSGSVEFIKRVNGNTLIVVNLAGASVTSYTRVSICENNCNVGGSLAVGLNPIMGGIGTSYTNVDQLYNGKSITYDEFQNFNGHLRVVTPDPTPQCVALSDMGSNF